MLEKIPAARGLLYVFLEQDGGGTREHVAFTWGDVDRERPRGLAPAQRRSRVGAGVGSRAGYQIPEWLMRACCWRHVLPGTESAQGPTLPVASDREAPAPGRARTMVSACKAACIPHFHPHDLRHRRISLWHGQGIPAREIRARVGQRQIAVTLDTCAHVMPLGKVTENESLHCSAAREGHVFVPPSPVPVWSRCESRVATLAVRGSPWMSACSYHAMGM